MKNQYFGDNKDLFTYDLIYQIMQARLVDHFTFIPMLTANDGNKYDSKYHRHTARVGTENKELMSFLDRCIGDLDRCIGEEKRDIKQLESFFSGYGIKMTTYAGKDRYFRHRQRQAYFQQIGNELLSGSLVFVDPDIGLEIAHPGEKHVLYSEVKDLYDRMDESSILMLFQHFPRQPHLEYLPRRQAELMTKISGEEPICIDDNEVIFFFLTKDEALEHELTHLIQDYAESYSR